MSNIKEFNIDVPMTLDAISLKTYQAWIKILDKYTKDEKDDDNYLKIKMLQIFCNLSIEDTNLVPLHMFGDVVDHISRLFVNDTPLLNTFTFTDDSKNEVEFGFTPSLDKLTFGEYVDLDKYISNTATLHKAMAVLFRPKMNILNGKYTIEQYEGSAKWSNHMLDMPVSVALGAVSFMESLQNQLQKHTLVSSQVQAMEELETAYKLTLAENTDGSKAFTILLKKMELKSMMQ